MNAIQPKRKEKQIHEVKVLLTDSQNIKFQEMADDKRVPKSTLAWRVLGVYMGGHLSDEQKTQLGSYDNAVKKPRHIDIQLTDYHYMALAELARRDDLTTEAVIERLLRDAIDGHGRRIGCPKKNNQ